MRLKLVFISALIAAVVGAGAAIALILSVSSSIRPMAMPGLFVFSMFLLPALTTLLASSFVYRHTARRRKLQSALTAIVALLLTLAVFLLASIYTARKDRIPPTPQTPPANVSQL